MYYFVFEIVLAYCIAVRYASCMVAARIATAKGDIHSRENRQLFSAFLGGCLPIQMPLQIHKNHKTHGTQAKHCLLYCPRPGSTTVSFPGPFIYLWCDCGFYLGCNLDLKLVICTVYSCSF